MATKLEYMLELPFRALSSKRRFTLVPYILEQDWNECYNFFVEDKWMLDNQDVKSIGFAERVTKDVMGKVTKKAASSTSIICFFPINHMHGC